MRYRILGTTQALRPDGNPVAVGGARLRALLAVLALRAGRSVPAGLLVEEVWAGEPPADAPGALQALVGRLRRALGADAIDSAEGGYRLAAAPDDVDLHRFERLTADGIRALADGDSAKAAVVLDDALALWQGPALADLPDGAAEAARWEARRLDAVRARHTAAIALGQAERSLPELTALCDAHPLDEPLQALRLRALREAGRTAQALAAYDGVRRMLADRLGTDPGPELRTLHAELLGHGDRGDAGMPPRPVPPEAPSGAPAPAAPAPPPPPLGNLRARLTSFVGRENDIAAIRADLATARLVTLLGPGGAGKTRLSQEAAEAVRDASRDGGRYASGDGGRDAARDGFGGGHGGGRHGTRGGVGDAYGDGGRDAARDGFGGAVPGGGRHGTRGGVGDASGDGGRDTARDGFGGGHGGGRHGTRGGVGDASGDGGRDAARDGFGGAVPGGGRHGTRDRAGSAAPDRVGETAGDGVPDTARDGVWLAELAPVADPDAVPQAVLTAVGARETVLYGAGAEEIRVAAERHDDPLERLIEHCARRRMLIVLDNCEHVVGAAARLVEELLARCPEVTVLATSREPLGVPGEVLRPLDPLPEPVALRLLADRGAAARPGFRTDADDETAAACAEICRRLDGLPLAIELAAARLRMLTPRQIADRLDDRFRLLTSGSRTVLPRQQTLRAVVDWSWDLLDEDERDVLARLSVFARGCDLDAVEAVCGPAAPDSRAGRDPLAPLDLLASLVDKSLVVAAPDHRGDMRYRLLETVAEYAGERLDESGRRAAAERAHLTYYRELARTTEPLLRGPGQRDAIDRFQLEYENLRTALGRAVAARDEQEALCLALSLVWYWQMRDLRIEARGWCLEVMALGPDPFAEPLRPAAPVWKSCIDAPPPMAGEILAEARRGVHLAHLACMDTEMEAWQTATSQNKLRRIAETYEPGQPQTCRAPGLLWFFAVMMTGAPDRIRAIIDANVDTCRRTPGYEWELASCLQMRANILANRADWAGSAFRDAAEALEIFRRLGDAWGTAEALSARAEAHERLGAYREAAADYEGAIEQAERLGARSQSAVLAARLGSALLEGGEEERGERVLREVISGEERAVNEAMHIARLFLAGWLGATGRHAESREQLRLLREEFTFGHFAVFDCFILGAEAWLDAVDGRYTQSLTGIRSALERATDPLAMAMAPQMRSFYLFIAATSLSRVDGSVRAADAARCLGAAETLLPQCHVPQRVERKARDLATAWTRAALGDTEFERAYAEGGGLSYEEATALV